MNAHGPTSHCTNSKLRQLARCVNQHYDAEVAQCGVRTTQYSLLSYVSRLGPVRPVDLAAAMRMTASTLSRNLQPLVAAGWLVVGAGVDARSRLVQITEAGSAKRQEAKRHWKLAQQQLNVRLGPERVVALHALIDESLALLGTAVPAEEDD
jgi:DNA-binding MarR family transcriptional regulator